MTCMATNPTSDQPSSIDRLDGTNRDGCYTTQIDLRVYRLSAVQKTAYRHARHLSIILGAIHDHELEIQVQLGADTSERVLQERLRAFFRDLLDQELREKVGDETRAIRALILAQAFSKTDLIQRDS